MARKPPAYTRRSQRPNLAIVTLRDSKTGKRKCYSLGVYDSPESRELYHRLIAQWEADGRRLPGLGDDAAGDVSVTELCLAYWTWMKGVYHPSSLHTHKDAIRIFRQHHGSAPAASIGPNALRDLRVVMVRERGWSRTYANRQCKRIAQAYKWGAARELVPASVYDSLRLLEPLRKGEHGARENTRRAPVDMGLVERTIEHLPEAVAAMVRVQMVTGMRPCALTIMRPCDLDRSGDVWVYTPHAPGCEDSPKYNPVLLGPRAQREIIPRLGIDQHGWVFGSYTTGSYRRAIVRACERQGLTRWTPYQLRHTVLTAIERSHGLIQASLVAGHASAKITDSVYTHRDQETVLRVVREVG